MMPTSAFSQSRIAAMKNVLAEWSQGEGGLGRYGPSAPSDHPHSPRLAQCGVHMCSVGAAGPVQQPEQMRLHRLCPISLPFTPCSIRSSLILWSG